MNMIHKAFLYWNTIKYLRPVQIGHQISIRIFGNKQKKKLTAIQWLKQGSQQRFNIVIPEVDYDEAYIMRFHPERLLKNFVELLHESHEIRDQWKVPEASHLWNYNLHYLEFLVPLAVCYQKTGDVKYLQKWKEYLIGWMGQDSGDSLEPYTISLRIPNILICMEILEKEIRGTEIESMIINSIYGQYCFLIKNTELSLLANHYFENLKTIIICSVLFKEKKVFRKYYALLEKQIREQILPDGLHFERSLMYHRIILEDILRIYMVLDSAGYREEAENLLPIVSSMTAAMENIEEGFDTIPLFNDAGNNVSKGKEQLLAAAKRICRYESVRRNDFPEAGYYKLCSGNRTVLFDCGEIGPSYMTGHSHCDCLSFELSVNGHKLFTNSGTGQYQGTRRPFFRSTEAHNTFMIDDREQSELWGEHRAARRISHVTAEVNADNVIGQYRSYQGDLFRRRLSWNRDILTVVDNVNTDGKNSRHDRDAGHNHVARQFFHLAPGYSYESECDGRLIRIKSADRITAEIKLPESSKGIIHKEGELTEYAGDFGEYLHKEVLEVRTEFRHKTQIKIKIKMNILEENRHG